MSKNPTDVLLGMLSYCLPRKMTQKRHLESIRKTWDPDTSSFSDRQLPKFSRYNVNLFLTKNTLQRYMYSKRHLASHLLLL